MKYQIIQASTTEQLEQYVNEALKNGAKLQGGVCVNMRLEHEEGRDIEFYSQAVVYETKQ